MSEAFKSFDWEKDENWLKYKNSVEIPSGNQTQVLEKLKIKFYQKFIDSNYKPPESSSPNFSNSNHSNYSSTSENQNSSASQSYSSNNSSKAPSSRLNLNSTFSKIKFFLSIYVLVNFIGYLFPLGLEWNFSSYRHLLFSCLIIYGLRIYQALGIPKFNSAFLQDLIMNKNSQYFFICFYLLSSNPVTTAIVSMTVNSLIYVCSELLSTYRTLIGNYATPYLQKVIDNQNTILFWGAYCEVVTIFLIFVNLITGYSGFLLLFGYYWFLNHRYVQNQYVHTILDEFGYKLDSYLYSPSCPVFISNIYRKIRTFLASQVVHRRV